MRKIIWWIVGGLILLFIGYKVISGNKKEDIMVATEKIGKHTIVETVTATGKVYPVDERKISSDVNGEITDLMVAEGDSVRKGQILARIYPEIYATQRDQASASVTQAQAQIENNTAALDALKARYDQAQINYNRQKKLLDDKVISKSEFETADNNLKTTQSDYNAAIKGIKAQQAVLSSARAQYERANKDLSRTTIVSPMDGVVSLLSVKKGEKVAGSSFSVGPEMMRIADMSKMEVRVDVSENDIPKVKLNDSADVEIDAYNNRKFKGVVTQIASSSGNVSTTATSTTDVTNYKVYIRLLPESYKDLINSKVKGVFPFRPGMSASADIKTSVRENILSVPLLSVTTREREGAEDKIASKQQEEKDKAEGNSATKVGGDLEIVVFVLQKDNTVKKVVIKTGIQDDKYYEVLGGLKEGDEVVSDPYTAISKDLKNGMKVKVVPREKIYEVKK